MPRQELLVIVRCFCQRQGFEQNDQIAIRICPVGLAGLDQRVQVRTGVGPGHRVGEEPIAPPHHEGSDRVLAQIMPTPGLCRVPLCEDTRCRKAGGARFRSKQFVGIIKGPQGRRAMGREA